MIVKTIKKCFCISALGIILSLTQYCYAAKSIIVKQDEYLDTDTNFFDGQGNKVFLDQYEDSTVLLVFWATWCGHCVSELPSLDNLQKDFRKMSFKVIAVSQDFQGVDVVKKHFAENGIRHLEVFHDYQNQLFKSLSVVGLPTAFLINTDGKIKITFRGGTKWYDEEIRALILAEIEGNPEVPKNTYKNPSFNKKVGKVIRNELEKTPVQSDDDKLNKKEEEQKNAKKEDIKNVQEIESQKTL